MGTAIVGIVVLAMVAGAVYSIRKDKKNGKSCAGCSGNCGGGCSCGKQYGK